MAKAKTLEYEQLAPLLEFITRVSKFPLRDRLFLLLTFYCGLRAQEVARLEFDDVTDVTGAVAGVIEVTSRAAKYGRPRQLPANCRVREELTAYLAATGIRGGPLFLNQRGRPVTPNSVAQQFKRLMKKAGFVGASSHSGRRTFITTLARRSQEVGCSLKDVQLLAGHANLSATEGYIELSPRQLELVDLLETPGKTTPD